MNIFKKLKLKKQQKHKSERKPGKDQPDFFSGAAGPKDLLAPSVIKEAAPGQKSVFGKVTDYWLEIGGTIEPVRYFRSFYANLTATTTYAGMVDQLYLGDFGQGDCDTAIHVRPADSRRTLHEIGRKIAGIESDLITENDKNRKSMLLTALRDLMSQQERLRVEVEKLFFVSIQAVASSNNTQNFRRFCNSLVKGFAMKGIYMRGADLRQLDALLAATPLDKEGSFKDTFRNMESSNVADLFPFGQGGVSHKTGIVIGEDLQEKPILYNGRDKSLGTGHICVVGRTSFGKTFAILMLIARSALIGIRSVVIEPAREFKKGILGLGCPYIDFTADSQYRFNIFDVVESEDEAGNMVVELAETVQAVQAFVFKLVRLVDERYLTGLVKTRIQEAIWKLYEAFEIDSNPKSLYHAQAPKKTETNQATFSLTKARKEMPTLSDMYLAMAKIPELQEIAEVIKPYTKLGSNPSQAIFDCQSNVDFKKAPITGISVAGLEAEIMQPLAYFVIQKCAWDRFGKADKKPTYIVMDEVQIPMDADVELARWIENGYRRGRHLNIWMITITQGFEVILRNPYGLGIIKNSPTKIFMRQESIDILSMKEKFALSEGEASWLLRAPKGHGILKTDTQSTIINFKANQMDLELFSNDPNKDYWDKQRRDVIDIA